MEVNKGVGLGGMDDVVLTMALTYAVAIAPMLTSRIDSLGRGGRRARGRMDSLRARLGSLVAGVSSLRGSLVRANRRVSRARRSLGATRRRRRRRCTTVGLHVGCVCRRKAKATAMRGMLASKSVSDMLARTRCSRRMRSCSESGFRRCITAIRGMRSLGAALRAGVTSLRRARARCSTRGSRLGAAVARGDDRVTGLSIGVSRTMGGTTRRTTGGTTRRTTGGTTRRTTTGGTTRRTTGGGGSDDDSSGEGGSDGDSSDDSGSDDSGSDDSDSKDSDDDSSGDSDSDSSSSDPDCDTSGKDVVMGTTCSRVKIPCM